MKNQQINTDVAIVGGGPAGLMLAIELGCRGIACVLLESSTEPPRYPKANASSARTMEHYRRRGFAERIRALGLPPDHAQDIVYCTRLGGYELSRFHGPSANQARAGDHAGDFGGGNWPSPELPHRAQQMYIEPVLRDEVAGHASVDRRYGWTVTTVEDSEAAARVHAVNAAGDATLTVEARYVVGCDGARSLVRKSAGIEFVGRGSEQREFFGGMMATVYFRSNELTALIPSPRGWQYWVANTARRGVLVAIDGVDLYGAAVQLGPEQTLADIDPAAILPALAGRDFSFEVLNVNSWLAGYALVSERYRSGRFLLAGDAAHLFTPAAGMGYNTSVDDVVNLGWKLAAVVRGWAPEALLDSYEAERRPIAERNTAYARAMADSMGGLTPPAEVEHDGEAGDAARRDYGLRCAAHVAREYDIPGLQLGLRYTSAVIAKEQTTPPPDDANCYVPSGYPGARAPHLAVGSAGADGATSLLDSFGREFTLLCLAAEPPAAQWVQAAANLGVPLEIVAWPDARARELYGAELVLIRPDHHIAWRGSRAAVPQQALRLAVGH